MGGTTTKGFKYWDLPTDPYVHTDLANNWKLLDTLLSTSGKGVQSISNLTVGSAGGPLSPAAIGDLAVTNTTVDNFPPNTLLLYNGTGWESVGPIEVDTALPTQDLFTGRIVLLSVAASNFQAWSLVAYNGSSWNYIGPFQLAYTGALATNISGVLINGDVYINSGTRGVCLTDRSTGLIYRLYINNGGLYSEQVS